MKTLMKKLFLLFTVLCAAVALQAQVISGYTVKGSQGTYTAITGGAVMDTTGMGAQMYEKAWFPDGIATGLVEKAGFPIGFDFTFNDIICNQFAIGTNGYLALGCDKISIDVSNGRWMLSREDNADNVLGVVPNADIVLRENTQVSYKLEGEAPNRTLVVQYDNWGVNLGWSDDDIISLDVQIRLHETTNTIEYVFGEAVGTSTKTKGFKIGLRGNYEDELTLAEGENEGMLEAHAQTGDNSLFLGVETLLNGYTFVFTAPGDCVTPVEAVTNLTLNATTLEIFGEFTTTTDAHKYLIMLTEGTCTDAPVNGKFYYPLDSIGNSIVMTFDAEDTITMPWQIKLKASTEYEVSIYPAATLCSGGPLYGPVVKGKVSSKPSAATSVDITSTTLNSLTLDVVGNGTDNVMVLLTDSVRENRPYANVIEFGNPQGPLAVGDLVDGLGRVVYMGPTAENVLVEGLEASTAYYVRAISYDANYNYATEVVEDKDATVITLPWCPDLSKEDRNGLPAGWTAGGQGKMQVNSAKSKYGVDAWQVFCTTSQNATTGALNTLSFGRFLVNQRDAALTFTYNMYIWGRFANTIYDAWAENDTLAVQVRRDGGEWINQTLILATNNAKVDSVNQYLPVEVDLTDYVNETVEIRLYWNCFASSGIYGSFEQLKADGRPIPVIPVVSVNDITWNSAKVTWRGEQEKFEFAYAATGEEFYSMIVAGKEMNITDLTHLTEYQVKVRGIVAEADTTEWSEVVTFTTTDLPACPVPDGLAHANTEDYGDKLTWNLNEEHLSWDLRYRLGTATTWTDVEGLETNEYTLYELQAGAAYIWRVRAHCDMDRVSEYASQETFDANGNSVVSAATADRFAVVANNGGVTVYNSGVYVESVALLDMQGRVLGYYEVNACDNITVPTNMTGVAIVVVKTLDKQFAYKVNVR